jgi:hypothetical protein
VAITGFLHACVWVVVQCLVDWKAHWIAELVFFGIVRHLLKDGTGTIIYHKKPPDSSMRAKIANLFSFKG